MRPENPEIKIDEVVGDLEAADSARSVLERSARRLALLQDITAALAVAVDPAEVGATIVDRVCAALDADAVSLRILREEGLIPLVSKGLRTSGVFAARVIPLDAPLPIIDALRGELGVWIESLEQLAADYPHLEDVARIEGYDACAALPLRTRGRPIGSLTLVFKQAREFDAGDRTFVLAIAEQCAQALDRAILYTQERSLRAAAEHDRAVLDGILETAPVGIGLLDRDLRFVRVNPVLARWNGLTMEEHVGRTPGELLPGIGWDELAPLMQQVLESGVPRIEIPVSFPEKGKMRRFTEAWYPVLVEGEAVGVGAIVREVTAEREAEEFQKHVLGVVGHDLRSPLAAVSTAAQLLRRTPLDEGQSRLVDNIVRGGQRIERVIGVLLDYTRAQTGSGIPVNREPCDISVICRAAALESEASNPASEVRCSGEGDPRGEWDADRLGQVLQNLVSNAVAHSVARAKVEVRWLGGEDQVEFSVENAGLPILPELLPRIFDPFHRGGPNGERSARSGNLGLGLFIARAIVLAHGGSIELESADARTVVTVKLPRRVVAEARR